jgi:hypothetical protein
VNPLAQEAVTKTVIEKAELLFPWLEALAAAEIQTFYTDFFAAIEQAIQSGDWSGVQNTIEEWQATAEVLADSALSAALSQSTEAGDWDDWEDVSAALHHQD